MALASAAAASGVHFTVVARGKAMPSGSNEPTGYVAYTKTQERVFRTRLTTQSRTAMAGVDLGSNAVIAVFLDGLPCSSLLDVRSVTRSSSTVDVSVEYKRPQPGVAMCVRLDTPYFVLSVSRKALGRPLPTHVRVAVVARS